MKQTSYSSYADIPGAPSRRAFLKGAGAAGMLALVNLTLGGTAHGAARRKANLQEVEDIDILNSALVLELIGSAFNETAIGTRLIRASALPYFEVAGRNHSLRGETFTKTIQKLNPDYEIAERLEQYHFGELSSETALLKTAMTLGGVATGGYTGGMALFKDKANLALGASAMQGVARELAVYRYLSGFSFSPSAFSNVLTATQVEEAIAPILGR